ncbi:MAG: DUF1343 domain-containing protein [Verrucomicrobia bacterium]|nr:DUF1343 domain-containing protein [Verrucomicrobiota bacterium]
MAGAAHVFSVRKFLPLLAPLLALAGCSANKPPAARPAAPLFTPQPSLATPTPAPAPGPVLLGIDGLAAEGFATVQGKRHGLLTHPAGVNRRGERTSDVLRRAPGVKLVALFAVEHGINNEFPAGKNYTDYTDKRTGLPVRSLYDGKSRKPTKTQLKDLDALVIDLQDIGTRSYTFISALKLALIACFENGVECIVLDRPNPLGGLKADGPPMDANQMSYVGAWRVPYVHGLTMGELARMAKEAPEAAGPYSVPEAARTKGKLTVVPMRGWTRAMRWSETGLTWVATSPMVQDFEAVKGYPMTGLGCELGGFSHGVSNQHAFRGVSHRAARADALEKELRPLPLAGVRLSRISVPNAKTGQAGTGLYLEIADYDAWRPTELSFWMMKLACKLEPKNPFAAATTEKRSLFLHLMGSTAFYNDLVAKGRNIDIDAWLRTWREQARIYQEQSKRFWIYR